MFGSNTYLAKYSEERAIHNRGVDQGFGIVENMATHHYNKFVGRHTLLERLGQASFERANGNLSVATKE